MLGIFCSTGSDLHCLRTSREYVQFEILCWPSACFADIAWLQCGCNTPGGQQLVMRLRCLLHIVALPSLVA